MVTVILLNMDDGGERQGVVVMEESDKKRG